MRSVKCKAGSEDRRIKATSLHVCGRNRNSGDLAVGVFQLLIVEVEEQLVLQDRSADRTAKVVETLLPLGASPVEVVSRIHCVVLEVVVEGAVKLIGSALADDVEDIAAAAVLGRGGRSNHVHFGHALALTLVNVGAMRQPNRAAVNQVAGEKWHASGNGLINAGILVATAATVGAARGAGSAGKQLQETGPAVRRIDAREVGQLLSGQRARYLGILGLQKRCVRFNFDDLVARSDFEIT